MPNTLTETNISKAKEEINKISSFYNLTKDSTDTLAKLEIYFSDYLEVVLTEKGFEVIIGGVGKSRAEVLAQIAENNGLPKESISYFLRCSEQFPEANLGLKICFGDNASLPSLYVRTKTTTEKGINFLQSIESIKNSLTYLVKKLNNNNVLYGLGFSYRDKKIVIKTYTIGDITDSVKETFKGFISYRIIGNQLQEEIKTYLPDSEIENFKAPNIQWQKIKNFILQNLNIKVAGHIGLIRNEDNQEQYKIYLERIGAIKTDFKAR